MEELIKLMNGNYKSKKKILKILHSYQQRFSSTNSYFISKEMETFTEAEQYLKNVQVKDGTVYIGITKT